MAGYALVLLDLDGTLFHHEGAAEVAAAGWFRLLGRDPSHEMIAAWFDAEERHVAAWHRGELDWRGQRRARIADMSALAGHPLTDPEALDLSFEQYLERYEASWRTFDDVHDVLAGLRTRGLKMAVLTNGQDEQQRRKVAAIGIEPYLLDVLSSDRIGFAKPDPQAFLSACDALAARPGEVLHVVQPLPSCSRSNH